MRSLGAGVLETMRALSVLGLLFLAFAHTPPVVGAGPPALAAIASADWCGEAPGDTAAHAPCHACRAAGAVLPLPCPDVVPAFGAIVEIAYAAPARTHFPANASLHPPARGPPSA